MFDFSLIVMGVVLHVLCLWSVRLFLSAQKKSLWMQYAKTAIAALCGVLLSLLISPLSPTRMILAAVFAAVFCEVAALFFLAVKQMYHRVHVVSYYDDGSAAKYYITGDKHRDFSRVKAFCQDMNTRRKDVLIVLGDAGFNYYGGKRDASLKAEISALNITLFCIHGNKENRPQNIPAYGVRTFCGGRVYYEPKYPNICFAVDGEIYTFEGKKYMVVGGAHSVDKMYCLAKDLPYWLDETPDKTTKERVEHRLAEEENTIFGMLTHTCPVEYLPSEMFMSAAQNAADKRKRRGKKNEKKFEPDIDRCTEIWLGELEKKLRYKVWYCGHYHIDKQIDRIRMIYSDIQPLHMEMQE